MHLLTQVAIVGFATSAGIRSAQGTPVEAFNSSPEVTIKNGTVKGYTVSDLQAEAFLGIPYARAPVSQKPRSAHFNFY